MRSITITELVTTFRRSLVALTPVADRALLRWHHSEAHDDWDDLVDCLYQVFVRRAVEAGSNDSREVLPLPRYAFEVDSYAPHTWIAVESHDGSRYAFARLLSGDSPFDTVQAVEVDLETGQPGGLVEIPWEEGSFLLYRRFSGGACEIVSEVGPTK